MTEDTTTTTEFSLFPNLPPELRHQIWTRALEQEAANQLIIFPAPKVHCPLTQPHLLSPILSVSRESRESAKLFFTTTFPVWKAVPRDGSDADREEWYAYLGKTDDDEYDPEIDDDIDDYDSETGDVFVFFKGLLHLNLTYTVALIGASRNNENIMTMAYNPVHVDLEKLQLASSAVDILQGRKPEPVLCTDREGRSKPHVLLYPWSSSFCLDLRLGGDTCQVPAEATSETKTTTLTNLARNFIAIHHGDPHCSYCACLELKKKNVPYAEVQRQLTRYDTVPEERDWERGYFDRMGRLGYLPDHEDSETTVLHLDLRKDGENGAKWRRHITSHAEVLGVEGFMRRNYCIDMVSWNKSSGGKGEYLRHTPKYNFGYDQPRMVQIGYDQPSEEDERD